MQIVKVIGFIPQDDRPVSYTEPIFFARSLNVEIVSPPPELLGHRMTAGDPDALLEWLRENAATVQNWVLSLDMLAYGGLVASRELYCDTAQAAERLIKLKQIKESNPGIRFYAFQSIRRLASTVVTSADLGDWWENHTTAGPGKARERNHRINLLAIQLLEEDVFERVHLLQEDARSKGPQLREQKTLVKLISEFGMQQRAFVTTGTDEGALVLMVRILESHKTIGIGVVYSSLSGANRTASYEDRLLSLTVHGQIFALGFNRQYIAAAETVCFVWCPDRPMRDLVFEKAYEEIPEDTTLFIRNIMTSLDQGKKVILLDLGYANGADDLFMTRLAYELDLTRLTGFSAWNTAANAAGFALCQELEMPDKHFLLLRLLSDWGYQAVVRPELNRLIKDDIWNISPENVPVVQEKVQAMMQQWQRTNLPSFNIPETLTYRLPWERTFELEISL